jgi:uncharacterized protein (DUF433 family)
MTVDLALAPAFAARLRADLPHLTAGQLADALRCAAAHDHPLVVPLLAAMAEQLEGDQS